MGLRKKLLKFQPAIFAYTVFSYVLFQLQVSLAHLRERRHLMDSTHEPAPPARLRWRVHGNLDKSSYFEVGRALAKNIQDLCATEGREFSSFANILDFGSGCGRVIQNFKNQSGQRRLYATDIDPDLVSWGKSNLHGIEWSLNGYWPPMLFEDNSFDLIYGISVFTHLDEDFQHAWLRELQRIARPGAILILTVHGEHVIRGLQMPDSSLLDTFEERGFVFLPLSSGRFKADGFPDFYQTSFHTKKYICNEWSAYFEILNYAERGITDHQDAVVLQKR